MKKWICECRDDSGRLLQFEVWAVSAAIAKEKCWQMHKEVPFNVSAAQ